MTLLDWAKKARTARRKKNWNIVNVRYRCKFKLKRRNYVRAYLLFGFHIVLWFAKTILIYIEKKLLAELLTCAHDKNEISCCAVTSHELNDSWIHKFHKKFLSKHVDTDAIDRRMEGTEIGSVDCLSGKMDNVPYNVFCMTEYMMKIASTHQSCRSYENKNDNTDKLIVVRKNLSTRYRFGSLLILSFGP